MKKLLEALVSAFIFIAGAEAAAYLLLRNTRNAPLEAFAGIRLHDDVLSLKHRFVGPFRTADFDTIVRTNADGYREDRDFALADLDVAFFGDSFTFGHGVNAGERYTDRFQTFFPGVKSASLAYESGFQPEHYEYFLNAHPDLAPKLVVVGLYLGNDLESDVRETTIRKSADDRIVDVGLPYRDVFEGQLINAANYRVSALQPLAKRSYFVRYALSIVNASRYRNYVFAESTVVPNTFNGVETDKGQFGDLAHRALDSLSRLQATVASRGGRLLVLLVPQNFFVTSTGNLHVDPRLIPELPALLQGDNIKTAVMRFCARVALACLDPSPVLTKDDYFQTDAHWNAKGHAAVATFLADQVAASGGLAPRADGR